MRLEDILPFYVVCDQSISMTGHLDGLNDRVREVLPAAGMDRVAARRTRLCLIGFSETAEILIPLSRLDEITAIPRLAARAETNFGAVFSLLRDTIVRDVDELTRRSHQIHRPAVFFLSDGQPTDPATWPASFARLVDPSWAVRPRMIAFGVGDADPVTISRIGADRAYLGGSALDSKTICDCLTSALISTLTRSGDTPRLPEQLPGFTVVRKGDLDGDSLTPHGSPHVGGTR